MRFIVAIMGRLPIVTPVYVYAAWLLACGVMVVPPLHRDDRRDCPAASGRRSLTAALLVVAVVAAGLAYAAPAYTYAQPLRRHARVLIDSATRRRSTRSLPSSQASISTPARLPAGTGRPTPRPAASRGAASPSLRLSNVRQRAAGTRCRLRLLPLTPVAAGSGAADDRRATRAGALGACSCCQQASNRRAAICPARVRQPALAGDLRRDSRPKASPGGRRSPRAGDRARRDARHRGVAIGIPGGAGWQSLPSWLPQEHAVWTLTAAWALAPGPDCSRSRHYVNIRIHYVS